jgi:ABC-type Fe3+/spermidine/putrescine transport system ATPase subunit
MKMRLGFSIAIHMKPDILLMDEVMAVGDFRFRQKCLDRVNEMRETMSAIFVSHSMNQVSLFCDRVIVLNRGVAEYEGPTDEAIRYYMSEIETQHKKPAVQTSAIKPIYGDLFHNEEKICNIEHYWADTNLNKIDRAVTSTEVNIVIKFQLKTKPKNLVIGVPIWDKNGNFITAISSDLQQVKLTGDEKGRYHVVLNFPELVLNPNDNYVSVVAIVDGPEFYYRELNDPLTVEDHRRNLGFITPPHKWTISNDAASYEMTKN